MKSMFVAFFSVFATMFRSVELFARSVENVAKVAEGESNAFYQESTIEQRARLAALRVKLEQPIDAVA